MAVHYIGHSIAKTVGLCLFLLGVLLMVFAMEKLTFLLDVALGFQIAPTGFWILFASMLPEVADYILPVTLVIAVHLVVLRQREAREYLILASAGVGPGHLIATFLGVSVVAASLSILVSGYVKPESRHLFRMQYSNAMGSALSAGLPGGRFYDQKENVLFIASAHEPTSRRMRAFGFQGERLDRLTLSNCAEVRAREHSVISELCDAKIYLFSPVAASRAPQGAGVDGDCRLCASSEGQLNVTRVAAAKSTIAFDMDDMFAFSPERGDNEKHILNLLEVERGGILAKPAAKRVLGYALLSLTCPFAVAVGVGSVAFTVRRTRIATLAAAIGLVVAAVALASSGLLFAGPLGDPVYLSLSLVAGAMACCGTVCAVILTLHQKLITPMSLRA